GRIAKSVVYQAREDGLRVGLIRPITLWPFPSSVFKKISPKTRAFLVVEMNYGQMLKDVRLAINSETPVYFLGRGGGGIPRPDEIYEKVKEINKELTE
ncbi:TPA: 3-methyl-2-oxobutanoate dehydrogenase subunit beta, partial [bacterium]|nr:3-methyl-2-oxobutanoate dehydrogenase subunit beta [bacterium]